MNANNEEVQSTRQTVPLHTYLLKEGKAILKAGAGALIRTVVLGVAVNVVVVGLVLGLLNAGVIRYPDENTFYGVVKGLLFLAFVCMPFLFPIVYLIVGQRQAIGAAIGTLVERHNEYFWKAIFRAVSQKLPADRAGIDQKLSQANAVAGLVRQLPMPAYRLVWLVSKAVPVLPTLLQALKGMPANTEEAVEMAGTGFANQLKPLLAQLPIMPSRKPVWITVAVNLVVLLGLCMLLFTWA